MNTYSEILGFSVPSADHQGGSLPTWGSEERKPLLFVGGLQGPF